MSDARQTSKEQQLKACITKQSVQIVTTGASAKACSDEVGTLTVDIHMDETDTAETKGTDNEKQSLPETKLREEAETSTASDSDISDTDSDSSQTEKIPSKWKFRAKILRKQFDEYDPQVCVDLLKNPSFQAFVALKKKLRSVDKGWIEGFLECDGLNVLLDCVDIIGNERVTQLCDALLLLECVSCVRKLVNSEVGLLCFVQHENYAKKLVKALDTNNVMLKSQVFELLTALCAHSNECYKLTIDALESLKMLKKQRYRFTLIVNELRMAELVPYKTTLMAFVNSIMAANKDLHDRMRVRNEFIGLGILDLINNLRNEDDEDSITQCDVFDDEKQAEDEELSALYPACVDINDHKKVFSALYNKVYNTPMADIFLTVLQTLLLIEPDNPFSDIQWNMVEVSVRRASLIDQRNFNEVAFTNSFQRQQTASKYIQTDPQSNTNQALDNKTKNGKNNVDSDSSPASPIKTDVRSIPASPPPPPPPPPPSGPPACFTQNKRMPTPKHKMKTLHWTKIPLHEISSYESVWKEISDMQDFIGVNYDGIEELFCKKQKPKLNPYEQRKNKAPIKILQIDSKERLRVNIVLKQFKCSHSKIISMIEAGDIEAIESERLRVLQQMLPQSDEISLIKDFKGDKEELENVEKFYLKLSELESFRSRIEILVLQDKFRSTMEKLLPNTLTYYRACRNLLTNESLKVFLRFVLCTGNFLNEGVYAGNAVGFKLNSLNNLMDMRANNPRVTLLHYLVGEAEKEGKYALAFVNEMSPDLSAASKITTKDMKGKVKEVKKNLDDHNKTIATCPDDVQNQMRTFLKESETDVKKLDKALEDIDASIKKLITYFCENEKSFNVDECIRDMNTFCEKVKQCQKENLQRQQQKEKADRRKKEMAAKLSKHAPPQESEEDGCIIDKLLIGIRKGNRLRNATQPQCQE